MVEAFGVTHSSKIATSGAASIVMIYAETGVEARSQSSQVSQLQRDLGHSLKLHTLLRELVEEVQRVGGVVDVVDADALHIDQSK
jgi:hypothetical protein